MLLATPPFEEGGAEIIFELKIANANIPTIIDTGSSSGFNLPCEMVRNLASADAWKEAGHASSFGNQYAIYEAQLSNSFDFIGHVIETPTVRCNEHHAIGIVGYQALKSYRLTVDLPNRRVRVD